MSNYIKIEQWMIEELHLNGNELVLFALVAGMPDGWYGTYATAAWRIGVTRRKVIDIFQRLEAKGLLEKVTVNHNVIQYKGVTKGHSKSDERSPLRVTKGHSKSDERSPFYNIIEPIENKLKDKSENNAREDNYQENGGSSEAEPDTTTPIHPQKKEKRKVAPKEKSAAPHLFTPPTEAEVAAYIAEKGWQVNAAHWHAYYTANGWKVGRSPMKDWRAAVKTWQYNGITNNKKSSYEQRKFTSGNDAFYGVDTL